MKIKFSKIMDNESGSALIITVLIIMVMTLTVMSAMTTSTIEVKIAGNEKEYNQCFYVAESGWQEAGEVLDELDIAPDENLLTFAVTLQDTTLNRINNIDYAYAVKSMGNGAEAGNGTGSRAFYYEIKSSCDKTTQTVDEPADIVVNVTTVYSAGY